MATIITVSFFPTIARAETPGFNVSPTSIDFGSVEVGYANPPAAQTITIAHNGEGEIESNSIYFTQFELTGTHADKFTLTGPDKWLLDAPPPLDATATVQPVACLTEGTYNASVTIVGTQGMGGPEVGNISVSVTFVVTAPSQPSLTMREIKTTLNAGAETNGAVVAEVASVTAIEGTKTFSIDGTPALPAGLGIDPATGAISVTDASALVETAATTVTVKVTGATSGEATGTITITVRTTPPLQSYTVTFDANGGSVSPLTMETGTDGELTSLLTPTRANYRFNGWYTAAIGGTKITTDYMFGSDTTVYAHWQLDDISDAKAITEFKIGNAAGSID